MKNPKGWLYIENMASSGPSRRVLRSTAFPTILGTRRLVQTYHGSLNPPSSRWLNRATPQQNICCRVHGRVRRRLCGNRSRSCTVILWHRLSCVKYASVSRYCGSQVARITLQAGLCVASILVSRACVTCGGGLNSEGLSGEGLNRLRITIQQSGRFGYLLFGRLDGELLGR